VITGKERLDFPQLACFVISCLEQTAVPYSTVCDTIAQSQYDSCTVTVRQLHSHSTTVAQSQYDSCTATVRQLHSHSTTVAQSQYDSCTVTVRSEYKTVLTVLTHRSELYRISIVYFFPEKGKRRGSRLMLSTCYLFALPPFPV
jgi:hypothetical protein